MAKKPSKTKKSNQIVKKDGHMLKTKASVNNKKNKQLSKNLVSKVKGVFRKSEVDPHKSFKRTYREDYQRETEIPGILQHIFASFRMIFKNYKLFLPLLLLMVILSIALVGLMGESSYTELKEGIERSGGEETGNVTKAWTLLLFTFSSGGLAGESKEVTMVFSVLVFLTIWLVTIFILRQRMAGHKIKLRDALYNSMTPLLSTLAVFVVAAIQCIPILLLIIAYSSAVQTDFLSTPFYALLFLGFAVLMIVLSGYLLSSSIIALLATSVPGLYPRVALDNASDLMMGRRIRFIIRLIALILSIVIMWVVVMLPLIMFDMFMKRLEWTAEIPFVPVCLVTMTCFTEIYITTYLYRYYRYLLECDS